MFRAKLVAGNWKMQGNYEQLSLLLGHLANISSDEIDIAVFPSAVYLALAAEKLKKTKIAYGAQNVSHFDEGAYTGEISTNMLLDFGCLYVIVGHSERRHYFLESDEIIAKKAKKAVQAGITPIVCVGETLEEYQAGSTQKVVLTQVNAILQALSVDEQAKLIFAYEPVWAIGTGLTAQPEEVQDVHALIRAQCKAQGEAIRILYGGSVKPDNAEGLFAMPDVDGALVGGASLKADQFKAICDLAGQ